jgi:hypothetical protein
MTMEDGAVIDLLGAAGDVGLSREDGRVPHLRQCFAGRSALRLCLERQPGESVDHKDRAAAVGLLRREVDRAVPKTSLDEHLIFGTWGQILRLG